MKLNLDICEIKRYLEYDCSTLDDMTKQILDECLSEIDDLVLPKFTYQIFDVSYTKDMVKLNEHPLELSSIELVKHLQGSPRIILLVATLGLQLDQVIKRLELTNLSKSFILNAVANEYIEVYLDNEINKLKDEYPYQTSRYSIGYGDLELCNQKGLIDLLQANKTIGVQILETHLLVPSKSVSAIIGITNEQCVSKLSKCPLCYENGRCSMKCKEGL